MKKEHQPLKRKFVVIPMISLAMLTPAGLTGAEVAKEVMVSTSGPSVDKVQSPNPENVKFSKEQAIEKVRGLFPILKDAQVQNVELGDSHRYPPSPNQMVWNIQWHYQKANSSYGFNSMIDAITGDLISTHLGFPLDEGNEAYYPPKVSKDNALKIAKDFLKKAAPSLSTDKLKENSMYNQPLFGPVRYSFNLEQTVQGILVPEESVNITVDGNGNVLDFYRHSSASEYPDVAPKVTLEDAIKKYKENVNLTLQYIPIRRGNSVDVFLGWKPSSADFLVIDAVTGEFLSPNGEVRSKDRKAYQDLPKSSNSFKPNTSGKQLTADEAAAIVEKVAKIPDGRTLKSKSLGNYRGNSNQSDVWNLTFRDDKQPHFGPYSESFAAVDANTGQILEFEDNRFGPPIHASENAAKPNKEEARKKAIELVQQLYPNANEQLKIMENPVMYYPSTDQTYSLSFQRFFNGKPVEGDVVTLTLNAEGKLTRFFSNQTSNLAEKAKGVTPKISKEEATKRYLADSTLQLQFYRFGDLWAPGGAENTKMKLVYQQTFKEGLHGGFAIDAADGKWKSAWDPGFDPQNKEVKPTDIAGHWAEETLQTLLRHQIIKPNEKGLVNPDQAITRGEWLSMIVKAVDPYFEQSYRDPSQEKELFDDVKKDDEYYPAARSALERKWIDGNERKLQLNQQMTREDLAVSLVRIVNYQKLAKFMDSEETTFADSAQIKSKGAVSLITRLGLMKGTDGKFNPNSQITKAEAASVIMGLVKLQGKTDVPIGQMYYR